MQNDTRRRIETVFEAARSRGAGPERQAYLDGACGTDVDLRGRVEALLAADEAASDFLEGPVAPGAQEGPGSSIGDYKLLQQIGEGGMGVVYMAEQERPVRRKVALKVIKLGMDTKQVIARFEAERQALAMMDHAHIARVLDAGATESGRPYFVMELVRGVPINEYCDTHKLGTDERLGLFVEVCRAVQHAHQKGVIHRDLKPTNVLVTSHDGIPVPKIIDFGVAKATNQRLTERTLFTEFHQLIGTPEYMSPEQAEMSGLDVDTRSDIYALGVLLYQLLTGTTPVDPKDLRTAGFEEMTRMIREDEAPAPSTRISKLGADGERIATSRGTDVGSLTRHFRGDLDWIVMKALEKDRTRRYETAAAFAEDVVRHLEDRPVEAGPPGALYRIAKFGHRNRRTVAAALVLMLVVALGLAGTVAGFLRARAEARRSGAIGDSLQDVLAMTDPARGAERGDVQAVVATVREVFGADHATYAAVLDTLAERLRDAGDFEGAAELSRESIEVWTEVYGDRHPNVAASLTRLGTTLRAQGRDEEAESALRASVEVFETGANASASAAHEARIALADLLANGGEYAEADELYARALAELRAAPSPSRFRILETLEQRSVVQLNLSSPEITETMRQIYEEMNGFYPQGSPMLAMAALGYGRTLFNHGDVAAAERYLREAIERLRECSKSTGVYFVHASDLLFQILRSRRDTASVLETDAVLRDLIAAASNFWSPEELASNQKYYARRMAERGLYGDALASALDAFQTLAEAGRPADERDSLRGDVVELTLRVVLAPDAPRELLLHAREVLDLAQADVTDREYVRVALGAVHVRLGEHDLARDTLESAGLPANALGGKFGPLAHAFLAMAHAGLGDTESARRELESLRVLVSGSDLGAEQRALVAEVEDLVEHPPSPRGDG